LGPHEFEAGALTNQPQHWFAAMTMSKRTSYQVDFLMAK
jgi:hypothetical protein